MAKSVGSLFYILSLFLLHVGCFVVPATGGSSSFPCRKASKRWKSASSSSLLKPTRKSISSSWSYLKSYFTKKNSTADRTVDAASAPSRHQSLPLPEPTHQAYNDQESGTITPCTVCGEIFPRANQLLDHHLALKHAVSELSGEDSGHNIVKIIFTTSWGDKYHKIHRILKIRNSPKALSRFEQYRELIKSKAAARSRVGDIGRRSNERCIADGNELLRFHCSTLMCDLGQNGHSALCNQQFCSVCGIIRSGFSSKLDGISTLSTSVRAHVAIPDGTIEEFRFMNVKRAMLICRVVAGRVGADEEEVGKAGGGFDSVVDEEELLVLNPRALLPCFVVVYSVTV